MSRQTSLLRFLQPRSDRDDDEMWQHQPKLFRTPKEAMKLETNGKHARTSEKWTDRAVGAPRQRGRGAAMCSRQHSRALLHGLPSSFRLSSSGSSESESETESTEKSSAKRLRLSLRKKNSDGTQAKDVGYVGGIEPGTHGFCAECRTIAVTPPDTTY
ncbi:hypothetical protein Bbelb_253950 [Branchiostoma belcheri]|nr:hypothetical protein Bbelb_253950 [Branchiostoma belcheri]